MEQVFGARRVLLTRGSVLNSLESILSLRQVRWPDGVTCPRCGSDTVVPRERCDNALLPMSICLFLPTSVLRYASRSSQTLRLPLLNALMAYPSRHPR